MLRLLLSSLLIVLVASLSGCSNKINDYSNLSDENLCEVYGFSQAMKAKSGVYHTDKEITKRLSNKTFSLTNKQCSLIKKRAYQLRV